MLVTLLLTRPAPPFHGKQAMSFGRVPTYNYTVTSTDPARFYCQSGTHCKNGMVFAINPTGEQTYDAFKANAIAGDSGTAVGIGTPSAAPSGTTSGSTAPAAP